MEGQTLFGPTVREYLETSRIVFDTHFGTVNICYFDDHGTPRDASKDQTPHFLHALEKWFEYYSKRNKTSTLKLETAQGKGFVISVAPISYHKVKENGVWFQLYMEKEGWKNQKGEFWKNGKKFDVHGDELKISSDVGLSTESSMTLKTPKDEIQVNVLLELLW